MLRSIEPSEAIVQNACLRLLTADRRVGKVWRSNSLAANLKGKDGKERPYWCSTDVMGRPLTVCDISGWMSREKPGPLVVEVKADRSGWRSEEWFRDKADDTLVGYPGGLPYVSRASQRLLAQWRHIQDCRAAGGFGVCVWSVDMLKDALDAWWEG